MPLIISQDLTGFMLGLLNILNMPSSSTPEMVVSLDAEEAFDKVEYL